MKKAEQLFQEVFSEASPEAREEIWEMLRAGAQFSTCFTSTKVHILTQVLNSAVALQVQKYAH